MPRDAFHQRHKSEYLCRYILGAKRSPPLIAGALGKSLRDPAFGGPAVKETTQKGCALNIMYWLE